MPLDLVHSLHPGKHSENAGIYVCEVTTNHPHKNILASNIPVHPNKAAGGSIWWQFHAFCLSFCAWQFAAYKARLAFHHSTVCVCVVVVVVVGENQQ